VGTSTEGIALLRVSEAAAGAPTPMEQDAIAIERVALTALEARISALKYVNALLRAQLDGARKDGNAWRKAAEAAQRLLGSRPNETNR
jgi:hypothetical protein